MKKIVLVNLLMLLFTGFITAQSTAIYSVTFDSNWSDAAHPHPTDNFPANAHWSKLVGATHNSSVTFLEMGGIATPGIEDVAELGANTEFFSEINSAIGSGFANTLIDGDGLPTGLGQIVIDEVVTTESYPLLTLVSMIAPSPDWIIAVNSVELLDGGGDWITEIVIDLYPYDAGTDSGTDYNSANADITPHDPISSYQGVSPFSSEKMGTLTISLEEVLSVEDQSLASTSSVYPNPTSNSATVSSKSSLLASVEVYNAIGEKVLSYGAVNRNELVLDTQNLSSGVYLVRLVDVENRETVKKLVRI